MIALVLLISASALALPGVDIPHEVHTPLDIQWKNYKQEFGKNYADPQEDLTRKANFANTLKTISNVNGLYGDGYLGINEYSDYSEGELEAMKGGQDPENDDVHEPRFESPRSLPLANLSGLFIQTRQGDTVDWRQYVTAVKNQGRCGSCWAFAATAIMETAWKIYGKGDLMELSDQQLLDCTDGCDCERGGRADFALNGLKDRGDTHVQQSCYPYTTKKEGCQKKSCNGAKVGNVYSRWGSNANEDEMADWIKRFGPVAMMYKADNAQFSFRGGRIWDGPCNGGNHIVAVVGVTPDYYIVKNSWGDRWADQGYFNMRRGQRMCNTGSDYQLVQP